MFSTFKKLKFTEGQTKQVVTGQCERFISNTLQNKIYCSDFRQSVLPMCSPRSLMVSSLTFRSSIHCIFVYDIRQCIGYSNFIFFTCPVFPAPYCFGCCSLIVQCKVREHDYSKCNKYKWNITFKNCEPLYCTSVTYIILYISYNSIKN